MIAGRAVGSTLTVSERLVIGRRGEEPGRLADDAELSRLHARITREPEGGFTIEDLASRHGTFVNGVRLTAPAVLQLDDSIEVGSTTMIVRSATGAGSGAPVPPPSDTETGAMQGTPSRPVVHLRVEVEPEQGVARLWLDDAVEESAVMRLEDGAWRWASPGRKAE